ncbi:DNA repair protein RadC [Pedobacter sp. CG_S7]
MKPVSMSSGLIAGVMGDPHPSGNLQPSVEYLRITTRLK